jgi:DNA-dependent RNA polymerase auxiliary subunit epsilon
MVIVVYMKHMIENKTIEKIQDKSYNIEYFIGEMDLYIWLKYPNEYPSFQLLLTHYKQELIRRLITLRDKIVIDKSIFIFTVKDIMEEIDSLYIDGYLEYTPSLANKKWMYFKGLYCLEVYKSIFSSDHSPSIQHIWNFLCNISHKHHQFKPYLFSRPFNFTLQSLPDMKEQINTCSLYNQEYKGYYDNNFNHL